MANSVSADQKGLEILERARKAKGWNRQEQRWYQDAYSTLPTLKRLWEGSLIEIETFQRLCQAVGVYWREVVDPNTLPFELRPPKYWDGVPDVPVFYGRTEELADLEEWITARRCRLVALIGMVGTGKTALAIKLVEQIESQFDYVIWYSLQHLPSLEKLLTHISQFLHINLNCASPPTTQNSNDRISELITFFRRHRCLLILDHYESILCDGSYAGHYREEYENYSDLIKRIGGEKHQSCLIVTSREQITEIDSLERRHQLVKTLKLEGLNEAARPILQAKGLFDEDSWGKLIQTYRGNPLILQMISTTINDMYGGRVAVFLRKKTTLFTTVIFIIIAEQFDRLSDLEKHVLYQLAQQKEPISLPQLQEILSILSIELQLVIESLMRRSLIEKSGDKFTLQPVVMEYVTENRDASPRLLVMETSR